MFGVVIPYFQRQRGVLARSLQSIVQQDVTVPVEIVVVDDGSPVPGEEEVENISLPRNFSLRIIRQKNAGPGAARNQGIEALKDSSYIAFLDSDDCWKPYHLSSAFAAFRHGFDCYTAEAEESSTGFRYLSSFFKDGLPLASLDFAPWAYELTQPMINFSVIGPISTSSTLVASNALIGDTRFNTALRTAGEDGLFRTMLAAKSPRTLVSSRVDTLLGKGVNIFSEGCWGDRAATMRSIYFLKSRLLMRPLVKTFPVAEERVEASIVKARFELCRCAFANIRRGDFPMMDFLDICAYDPLVILSMPKSLVGALVRRLS